MEGISASDVIIALVGFIQLVFGFIGSLLVSRLRSLESKIESNKSIMHSIEKNLSKKIDDDIKELRAEFNETLDKHYATNGDLNTLEQRFIGEIKGISDKMDLVLNLLKDK